MINEIDKSATVGLNVTLWGVRVRERAIIGPGCILGRNVYIDHDVRIGSFCKIQNNALIYCPAKVGDGVFIGPGAMLLNDKYPRATNPDGMIKNRADWWSEGVTLNDHCSIGGGVIIFPGITIGEWAMVGAGSVVTKDIDPYTMSIGNPAVVIGMVCRCGRKETDCVCERLSS